MSFQRIEKLLEKYYNGDSSSMEEKELKDFFDLEEVPSHLKSLKPYFNYLSEETHTEVLDQGFDERLMDEIQNEESQSKKWKRKLYLYIASGTAACVLLVLGLFVKFDRIVDTYDDPQLAFTEAKNALMFFSTKLNSGLQPAGKVVKFQESLQETRKIGYFNQGVEEARKASKFYEIQKEIFNQ